jgi:hypothetical protein
MRKLHITNSAGRDATVQSLGLSPRPGHPRGIPADGDSPAQVVGHSIRFAKFLATTGSGLHDALAAEHGEDYGDALIQGDPEVDIESVGRFLGKTDKVFLSSTGDVLYAAPEVIEVIYAPDGSERDRRAPQDVPGNVNEVDPVSWTGKKMPKAAVVTRFAFRRTLQVRHVDGLTYDFLFGMAKELSDKNEMVLIGAGPGGKKPLVFQTNGTPCRGFLEGRVDGERYKLLLHLSNMELKLPEEAS